MFFSDISPKSIDFLSKITISLLTQSLLSDSSQTGGDGSSELEIRKEGDDINGAETLTFDTSTNNLTATWANLEVECTDLSGRKRTITWEWR